MYALNRERRVSKPSDIPNEPHWIILDMYQSSYTVPGDERSRTAPGHGYPEHTVTNDMIVMYVYKNEVDWKQELSAAVLEARTSHSYEKHHVLGYHVDKVAHSKLEVNVSL